MYVGKCDGESKFYAGFSKIEVQFAFTSLGLKARAVTDVFLRSVGNIEVKYDGPPRRPLERSVTAEPEKLLK